jgi:hypothetical protein
LLEKNFSDWTTNNLNIFGCQKFIETKETMTKNLIDSDQDGVWGNMVKICDKHEKDLISAKTVNHECIRYIAHRISNGKNFDMGGFSDDQWNYRQMNREYCSNRGNNELSHVSYEFIELLDKELKHFGIKILPDKYQNSWGNRKFLLTKNYGEEYLFLTRMDILWDNNNLVNSEIKFVFKRCEILHEPSRKFIYTQVL